MPKDKQLEWNHVTIVDDVSGKGIAYVTMRCIYCDKTYSGGVNRIRSHLVSGDTSISKCDKAPEEAVTAMKTVAIEKTQRDHDKKKRGELDKLTKGAGSVATQGQKAVTQTSIAASFNAGSKALADSAVAKMFYAAGIPFSIVENKYFKEAFSSVAKCGPSYKLPSRAALAGNLLNDAVIDTDRRLSEFKVQMPVTGGTMEPRNIESLGEPNIVQVVTDSAGNCSAARKILNKCYPGIIFSPCTAHCLDLLLEDIGKLAWTAPIISDEHRIVKFITNHQSPLAHFRKKSTTELLKPGATRFASYFIMLQRLLEAKDALQETVIYRESKQWVTSVKNKAIRDESKAIGEKAPDESFWQSVTQLTSICEPTISLLRLQKNELYRYCVLKNAFMVIVII